MLIYKVMIGPIIIQKHGFVTIFEFLLYYLLGKGGYVLVALVSLSVCLSVDNITQKVMNGSG